MAFTHEETPCPALRVNDLGLHACGLVLAEKILGSEEIAKILGVSCGCSCPDEDTSDEEILEFDRRAFNIVYEL